MSARQRWLLLLTLLFLLVLASALALVVSKHEARKLFAHSQQLQQRINALDAEWGQLQLEQSAWSGNGRIERKAREELSMIMPAPDDIVFVIEQ